MTEQEAVEGMLFLKEKLYNGIFKDRLECLDEAIKALEEIQEYRALGTVKQIKIREAELGRLSEGYLSNLTVLREYQSLGTVEELRVARDKQVAKKPICKEMPYSEDVGFNDEYYCPTCGAYVGYGIEGMSEPEQMEYCNECGQHIAKD